MKNSQKSPKWLIINNTFKRHCLIVICMVICLFTTGIFRTLGSSYIKNITEHIQENGSNGIGLIIAITCLIQVINYSSRFLSSLCAMYLNQRAKVDIKVRSVERLQQMPYRNFENYKIGDIQSIIQNDSLRASGYIFTVFSRLSVSIITGLCAFIAMSFIDFGITLFITGIALTFGFVNYKILKKMKSNEKKSREKLGEITEVVVNSCQSIDTIKTYKVQEYMLEHFVESRSDYNNANLNITRIDSLRLGLYALVKNITFFSSALFLASSTINGTHSIGDVLAYLTLLIQMLWGIEMAFKWMRMIVGSNVSWNRISSILLEDVEDYTELQSIDQTGVKEIQINDLSYTYDGKVNIFEDYNIKLKKGEIYGIVGESGSGKTTLLKCILGLYSSKTEKVYLDGESVTHSELKSSFAYVPSNNYLFIGTIFENITFGNSEITKEKCIELSKLIGIDEWINSLPNGIDSRVEEAGENFSGGQRQALCILRAILSDRPILVLDEPFSALDDSRSDKLQKMLNRIKDSRVIIFTSHRSDSFTCCDKILNI